MLIEAAMICSGLWMSNRHDWILEYHEHLGSPLRYANICCVISAIILYLLHGFFVFQRYEMWYADRVLTALAFSQYPSYLMLLMFGLLPFKYSLWFAGKGNVPLIRRAWQEIDSYRKGDNACNSQLMRRFT